MTNCTRNTQRGFTLIEITLAIGILAGIVLATVALFGAVTAARAKIHAGQEVASNARIAMAIMEQRIRSATAVNSGSSTFGVHPGILSLNTASSSTNPTVIALSMQRLQLSEGAQAATSLTSAQTRVSNLVFTSVSYPGSSGGVGINLTLEYNNPQTDPNYFFSRNYQTTVILRP